MSLDSQIQLERYTALQIGEQVGTGRIAFIAGTTHIVSISLGGRESVVQLSLIQGEVQMSIQENGSDNLPVFVDLSDAQISPTEFELLSRVEALLDSAHTQKIPVRTLFRV